MQYQRWLSRDGAEALFCLQELGFRGMLGDALQVAGSFHFLAPRQAGSKEIADENWSRFLEMAADPIGQLRLGEYRPGTAGGRTAAGPLERQNCCSGGLQASQDS
jgi:hypothetical protein